MNEYNTLSTVVISPTNIELKMLVYFVETH